jgi:spore germination protein KB
MFQDREKISGHQALMLILAGGIGNIFVVLAVPAIKDAGRDGWLTVLIGYGLATVVGLILVKLGKRFPDQTVIQYLPTVVGKPLGKFAGLVFICTFWMMSAVVLREIVEQMRFFLPETPPLIIVIMMIFLIVYAMKKGFETYARTAEVFSLLAVFFIVLLLVLNLPNTAWKNITPVLADGFFPILKGLPLQFSYGLETLMFMSLWFPCLNKNKEGSRAVLVGLPLAGALLSVLVAVIIAFTGTTLTTRIIYPVFYMSEYLLIGNFLQGFEAIFMLLWLSTSYLEILVFFYPPVVGLAQWLNLKDYQPLILPMAVILIILAMQPSNIIETLKWDAFISIYIKLPMGLLIPVAWVIALIRGLGEKAS